MRVRPRKSSRAGPRPAQFQCEPPRLIDRDPAIRGGRPKIAGHWSRSLVQMGLTPEEIAAQYGYLKLPQVHAALAYYHASSEEIEADLAEEEAFAEEVNRRAKNLPE